jgi:hypothetical protein
VVRYGGHGQREKDRHEPHTISDSELRIANPGKILYIYTTLTWFSPISE